MRFLILLSLLALGTHANAGDPMCINQTCPVDGKPVDASVKMVPFNSKTDTKGKADPAGTADMVGFCSEKCKEAYLQNPDRYRDNLDKQHISTK